MNLIRLKLNFQHELDSNIIINIFIKLELIEIYIRDKYQINIQNKKQQIKKDSDENSNERD